MMPREEGRKEQLSWKNKEIRRKRERRKKNEETQEKKNNKGILTAV